MSCSAVQAELATALLTRTTPTPEVVAHVAGCDACTQEAALLAPMPALLDRLRGPGSQAASEGSAGQPDLLVALLDRASRGRRGRRIRLVAAAAALVLIAGAWLSTLRPAQPTLTGAHSAQGMSVAVVVEPSGSTSRLTLTTDGLPVGITCRVDAVTVSGARVSVLTWTVAYTQQSQLAAAIPVAAAQLSRVELVAVASGKLITDVALHRSA